LPSFYSFSGHMTTSYTTKHPTLKENILSLVFILIAAYLLAIIPRIENPLMWFFILFLASVFLIIALSLKGFVDDIFRFYTKEDAIKFCGEVAQKTNHDYFSLGGECNAEFYEDKDIIRNLSKLIEKNVKIRILFGPNYDLRSIHLLEYALKFPFQIEVRRLKRRYPGDHFKVADDEFIHVGYTHPPLASEREGYIKRSRATASAYKQIFEEYWKSAEIFNIEKMVCKAKPIDKQYLDESWMKVNDAIWGRSSGFITINTENSEVGHRSANENEIEALKSSLGIKCL